MRPNTISRPSLWVPSLTCAGWLILTTPTCRYHLPPAKTMLMPEPNYLKVEDFDEGRENFRGVYVDKDREKTHRAGWMSKFCESAAGDIVCSAVTNVSFWSTEATRQLHHSIDDLSASNST